MTPAQAVVIAFIPIGLLVAIAALDNLYRAAICAWRSHDWFISYMPGGRYSECSKCGRRVEQR